MSAAEALARAEAAGVRLWLRLDGGVRDGGRRASARRCAGGPGPLAREDVARLLMAREGQPECVPASPGEYDAAEAAAMAQHYAAPAPSARAYLPGDSDPLRDGLLAGARMRPPAWDGAAPPRGAWCSSCGAVLRRPWPVVAAAARPLRWHGYRAGLALLDMPSARPSSRGRCAGSAHMNRATAPRVQRSIRENAMPERPDLRRQHANEAGCCPGA